MRACPPFSAAPLTIPPPPRDFAAESASASLSALATLAGAVLVGRTDGNASLSPDDRRKLLDASVRRATRAADDEGDNSAAAWAELATAHVRSSGSVLFALVICV